MSQVATRPTSKPDSSSVPEAAELKASRRASRQYGLFEPKLLKAALFQSFAMLRPDIQWKNPVMFVVEIGTVLTLICTVARFLGYSAHVGVGYLLALDFWLIMTLLFANFASALAETRGKAQADALRKTRRDTRARRLTGYKEQETFVTRGISDQKAAELKYQELMSSELREGEYIFVSAGEVIASDGEIVEGVASIDESAITGESAPVIREAGGDRSGVTGGTRVLSDRVVVRVTAAAGKSFLDKMIALVEGAIRQRTPNEIALSIVLAAFTLIFLIVTAALWPMALHAETYMQGYLDTDAPVKGLGTDVPTLVALLVCLIPTTIGALLAAIGIAGMDRALRANIIAKSGKAVEVAGDVDTLLLDKTGTITMGNRRATRFIPIEPYSANELARLTALASVADQTPEGQSLVDLHHKLNGDGLAVPTGAKFVAFSAQTRMSGIDLADGNRIRKGAPDAVIRLVEDQHGTVPHRLVEEVRSVSSKGATALLVCEGNRVAGVAVLEDVLKPGMKDRFQRLRQMGLRTVMITGDNPLTATAIAAAAGVDDFLAEATPEAKLAYIRKEQAEGKLVAMMGDGTNDAPALAQADVGVAMNSGTQAAKEAGNMVDLDSDPTKLIEVVEIGKQLLMTRGSLTTFSIANDLAKYFAIVPALFAGTLPWLKPFDIMNLHSATSAILSAVIFNAIIIPLLIPIALKGVRYRPVGADALLRRNLLVWGLGGVIVPFIGIKLIDLVLTSLNVVA
jgi:K+-transporting ATPase ATPase B chain